MTIAILAKLKISYWLIDVKRIIFIVLACHLYVGQQVVKREYDIQHQIHGGYSVLRCLHL